MRGFGAGVPVEDVGVGVAADGAGDDGFPSVVGVELGAEVRGAAELGAGPVPVPVPAPDASGVQPAASATAAAARTTLRTTDEYRFIAAPRGVSCVRRDASRARAVAHLGNGVRIL
ncbi:hypothetical protein SVTN_23615 [Streptomyces vietnamensis]|uniref:Uncharacterized protein n=1 Tax=Streptomyces vietnamensis TaxID=362257 RepID=A0A0B5I2X1_9ACTN|nr:hypothetical protein SVTN_23615 [Streptomyces vietnamensis]